MKIAIFGGTFDPPHLGHMRLIENIRKEIKPDKIIIIPAYVSPFKAEQNGITPARARLKMCELAFGAENDIEISDIEIARGGNSYSYDTVMQLRSENPDDDFYLIVGSDQLLSFRKWYKFDELLKSCTLVTLSRLEKIGKEFATEVDSLRKEFAANIILLNDMPIEVSSTQVRGGRVDMVCPAVADYIRANHLYS